MGKLTDKAVKNAKTHDDGKPRKYSDGNGLYLHVMKSGKYWRYDYQCMKKRKTLSIGIYDAVGLADARRIHEEARRQLKRGEDPSEVKKQKLQEVVEAQNNTFQSIALEWHEQAKSEWSAGHQQRTKSLLVKYVFPFIGKKPIAEIKPRDVLRLLQLMEKQVTEATKKTKQVIGQVFRYGIILGVCERDITADLKGALKSHVSKKLAAITDAKQLGDLLRAIDTYDGAFATVCALRLSALLMLRPYNIRTAKWSEIDMDAALLEISAKNIKLSTPLKRANRQEDSQTVPLPRQAVEVLREIYPLTSHGDYVFPSIRGRGQPMSENTVNKAIKAMGFGGGIMTAHGFRTTASTMLNEKGFRPDVVEKALFHKDTDKVRATYNRAAYLEERREMMQAWADYLDVLRSGADVIPIKRNKA